MKSELGKNHSTDIGEIPISNISLLKKKKRKERMKWDILIYLLYPIFNLVYMLIFIKDSLKNFHNKSKWFHDNNYCLLDELLGWPKQTFWPTQDLYAIKLLVNLVLGFFEGLFETLRVTEFWISFEPQSLNGLEFNW